MRAAAIFLCLPLVSCEILRSDAATAVQLAAVEASIAAAIAAAESDGDAGEAAKQAAIESGLASIDEQIRRVEERQAEAQRKAEEDGEPLVPNGLDSLLLAALYLGRKKLLQLRDSPPPPRPQPVQAMDLAT